MNAAPPRSSSENLAMEQRTLGREGPAVSAIGFGAMSVGIADIYGDSELKVGAAIKNRRQEVVLATKFGFVQEGRGIDGRPEHVQQACERSLKRLGVDLSL